MAALPLVFALVLATAVLATSILIFVMGARFQKVEQAAYLGDRRPWWFIVGLPGPGILRVTDGSQRTIRRNE